MRILGFENCGEGGRQVNYHVNELLMTLHYGILCHWCTICQERNADRVFQYFDGGCSEKDFGDSFVGARGLPLK